ncbi:hypothetical protein NE237_033306 [Protea cynaroides]|uniref:Uncharacterized protein n=1 Tax=Protea cynaroides TaxID=273540 RepID=A0A9Q0R4E6_9MAGN|nr:hypothetical protein NE237_033306 [Protea cynaroides]
MCSSVASNDWAEITTFWCGKHVYALSAFSFLGFDYQTLLWEECHHVGVSIEEIGLCYISWKKFEAMCLEVEDIVCQETTKYVENQVQSVGVSVKKFYAEIVQDLLPPSFEDSEKSKEGINGNPIKEEVPPAKESKKVGPDWKDLSRGSSVMVFPNISHLPPLSEDPIKGTDSDLSREQNEDSSVTYGMLKFGVEESTIEDKLSSPKVLEAITPSGNDLNGASLLTGLHNENNDKTCDTTATALTLTSVDVAQCNSNQGIGKIRNEIVDAMDCTTDVSSASSASLVLADSFLKSEAGSGPVPSGGIPPIELNDNSKNCITVSSMRGNGQKDYDDCAVIDAILLPPDNVRSDGYNEEMAVRSDEESINECHRVKLEESCVLVDSDELHIVSQRISKNRSYKKKLRDAFASRMKSGKKQEYERLALLCGDIDTGTNNQIAGSSQISFLPKKLPSQDLCDSEWEIV